MNKLYTETDHEEVAKSIGRTAENMRVAKRDYLTGKKPKGLWPVFVDAHLYRIEADRPRGHTVTITVDNWPKDSALADIVKHVPYQAQRALTEKELSDDHINRNSGK
jgi:hypothetical protein